MTDPDGTDAHICRTGRHEWTDAEDALKCCHPAWRRNLIWKHYVWVRRDEWEGYPDDWPKCFYPDCDKPAQAGHLTCGWASCPESEARHRRDVAVRTLQAKQTP